MSALGKLRVTVKVELIDPTTEQLFTSAESIETFEVRNPDEDPNAATLGWQIVEFAEIASKRLTGHLDRNAKRLFGGGW